MNQKQTDITTGKQIRHLRTQSGMFDENDAHDVKLLCETLHIEIPNEYR